ncbi:MAG: FkbM family methyltransferase [Bacteroidota bacterium]|nr:FkbM family methyltransferase [Bacteroidota bacterium]
MIRNTLRKLKKQIELSLSPEKRDAENLRNELEAKLRFLKDTPRYTEVSSDILGKNTIIPDTASFLYMRDEIFKKEIYKFNSSKKDPVIIDCGANIGMSVIYFKQQFPQARLTAFEPDPHIFSILKKNVQSFGYDDITLLNNALWDSEKDLDFSSEGADAGRISSGNEKNNIKIKTLQLSKFLDQPVDLLKIDIEGAEYTVLKECQSGLKNVSKMFLEYHSFLNQEQTLDEILSILRKAGFRYNINHIGVISKQPFISVNSYSGMDLQLNIFAYR